MLCIATFTFFGVLFDVFAINEVLMDKNCEHIYSYSWEDVATSSICQKYIATCSRCGYSYVIAYDYEHNYTDCEDSSCNDCGYTRPIPGHSYSYSWVSVSTASICQKYVATCSRCGYSYVVSYDYVHYYPSSNTQVCRDCGYVR